MGSVHPKLRLMPAPPAPPPLPDVAYLYRDGPRRPGELHEPLALDPEAQDRLARSARSAGLPMDLTARLLIEAALLVADLEALGAPGAAPDLDIAAAHATVQRRMSAAEADYLRRLSVRRWAPGPSATIPVRLIGRLSSVDVGAALHGDATRAVVWEVAALVHARTMLEWGLTVILRAR